MIIQGIQCYLVLIHTYDGDGDDGGDVHDGFLFIEFYFIILIKFYIFPFRDFLIF